MKFNVQSDGFSIITGVIDAAVRENLLSVLGPIFGAGRRGLLGSPPIAAWAHSESMTQWVRPHLSGEPRPVRAIYFDKSPDSNWRVDWHQDLTLALGHQVEVPGFGLWSVKDGIPHVQPPVELLEQMLTVRVHLDEADESNGALRVLPGTQDLGRLTAVRIQELRGKIDEHLCAVSAGDAVLMRPLLLHASNRSTSVGRRRVLHIEYAGFALPPALKWHAAA